MDGNGVQNTAGDGEDHEGPWQVLVNSSRFRFRFLYYSIGQEGASEG